MKVSKIMITDCPKLPKGLTIRELVDEYILHTTHRCFPVIENDNVLGVVTLQNIKEVPRDQWETTKVEEAMTLLDKTKAVRPDDGLYAVLRQMAEEGATQLPVIDNGQLVGMIARDNLASFISARSELGV